LFRRFAAAHLENELGREFESRHRELRIHAALEAKAGVRHDAELSAGQSDIQRFPECGLEKHVRRCFRDAACLPTHDPGKRLDALIVGNHADLGVELIGSSIERKKLLALLGAAHDKVALDLRCVEHVQRPCAVVGQKVGHIDERIDRPQADRAQFLLRPVR
jgi:hypothetical protein